MRASAAILILAACPCFIQTQNRRVTREAKPDFTNTIDENVLTSVIPCVFKLGLTKCVGAFGMWRAEKSLEGVERLEKVYHKFPWQRFINISNEELYTNLCDRTERLLQRRPLELNINQDYGLQLGVTGNGSLHVDIIKNVYGENEMVNGRSSMKKLQKHFYNLMPFLLMPGLIMSAVLPFILPSLKMMTIAAGMLNNMALTGAVFTLLRNNAFDDKYHKKVIYINDGYVNDGYFNDKYEPFADTPSQVIVDPLDNKYEGFVTHDVKDYLMSSEPIDDYQVNSNWLQNIAEKEKNVQILNNNFDQSDWRKRDTAHEKAQENGANNVNSISV